MPSEPKLNRRPHILWNVGLEKFLSGSGLGVRYAGGNVRDGEEKMATLKEWLGKDLSQILHSIWIYLPLMTNRNNMFLFDHPTGCATSEERAVWTAAKMLWKPGWNSVTGSSIPLTVTICIAGSDKVNMIKCKMPYARIPHLGALHEPIPTHRVLASTMVSAIGFVHDPRLLRAHFEAGPLSWWGQTSIPT